MQKRRFYTRIPYSQIEEVLRAVLARGYKLVAPVRRRLRKPRKHK